MSAEDTASPPDEPAPTPEPASAPAHPPPRPARTAVAMVIVLALVAALAVLGWRAWQPGADQRERMASELQQLQTRLETTARTAEQARREAGTLRARLDDADKVNRSLREQLLGFGERARLLEDAVANLADKRLSGHDALLLNEAEMLLALGGERYTLFHDAGAAIDAYRAADTALASIEDAAFSTVRQSISAEIDALNALGSADTGAALATLAAVRADAARLAPARPGPAEMPADAPRWQRLLGEFVRVRHGADAAAANRHDAALARQLLALDLREAEAALLARDEARFRGALADAQGLLAADFDAGAAPVAGAREALQKLATLTLAPPPPNVLGTALKELRNLRATHALQQAPKAAAPAGEHP